MHCSAKLLSLQLLQRRLLLAARSYGAHGVLSVYLGCFGSRDSRSPSAAKEFSLLLKRANSFRAKAEIRSSGAKSTPSGMATSATANDAALASALQAEFDAEAASDSPALGEHCFYCFDVLSCHFRRAPPPPPAFPLGAEYPLFVTWNKRGAGGHLDLRGCIGCLKPLPIASLKEYALTSSLRDRRFAPMQEHEVPLLTCEVTLLTHFERAAALDDWEIGVHGVHIDYVDPRGDARTAVYLPQVMPEQGWDKPQTIDSLVRKSGWQQPITDALRGAIVLTRFQGTKVSRAYDDWVRARTRTSPEGVVG